MHILNAIDAFGAEPKANDPTFLPSWSWADWIGRVDYPLGATRFESGAPNSDCEPLVEGGYSVLVAATQEADEANKKKEALYFIELRPEEIHEDLDPTTDHPIDRPSLHDSRLRFFAPIATFHLAPTFWGSNFEQTSPIFPNSVSRAHQIFINTSFAGAIFPHIPFSTSLSELRDLENDCRGSDMNLSQVELVALAKAPMPWGMCYPYNPDDENARENDSYLDEDGEEEEHVPFDHEILENVQDGGRVVNVLMIEREDVGGVVVVARRTGIGQVHRDAWEMAGPRVEEVILG
ncbi:hypothetical protein BST61_g4174 [Cercospora zeina]